MTYHLANNPHIQRKLQAELDAALGHEDDYVATFDSVKRLPYLQAVIDETLRIHATSGIGLPRIVPEGGLTVCGESFPEGTVLSVPTFSIHRDKSVWGEDVDVFRPERWLDDDAEKDKERQKAFNPFSFGPRSCVGRNLASMEMLIIIASILRRFDFVLEYPEKPVRLSLSVCTLHVSHIVWYSSWRPWKVSCVSLSSAMLVLRHAMLEHCQPDWNLPGRLMTVYLSFFQQTLVVTDCSASVQRISAPCSWSLQGRKVVSGCCCSLTCTVFLATYVIALGSSSRLPGEVRFDPTIFPRML